jgi:hypothetical protein
MNNQRNAMKAYLAVPLLVLTAGLAGCMHMGWQTVQGSGRIVTEPRQVRRSEDRLAAKRQPRPWG